MRRQWCLYSSQRPSDARLRLLTYPMALAQPHAHVPLLSGAAQRNDSSSDAPLSTLHVRLRGGTEELLVSNSSNSLMAPRRWVRGPDELCVASVRRSNNVNRMNTYIATYKFDDPQWSSLLLPPVKMVSQTHKTAASPSSPSPSTSSGVSAASPSPSSVPPGEDNTVNNLKAAQVEVDHNKLLAIETMARHVNFSLRHIVQKGHGVYLLTHAQHSILYPKGLIEQSFVTCAFGIRGERLRTDILHVGPLNAMDVLEVERRSGGGFRCTFNLDKPNVPRGVVAVSQVEGYGTWFQRKPMLWQRSRRIGALQSQLGAFAYDLPPPHEVGRERDCEVSLLASHMRFLGGGADAVGLIASSQIAQQDRLYLGEFEAPAIAALDVVHQLAHASALRGRLITPAPKDGVMETLLPISWATRTPPPYVPLEADLPFKLQMSRPAVVQGDALAFPTGGTVSSPFVRGAPTMLFEYNMHQGVDHYVFDDAPSARPMKWWSQKSNMPYSGYMYFVRSGLLDSLESAETIPNPFDPTTRRPPLHTLVPPSKHAQRRVKRYRRKEEAKKSPSKEKVVKAESNSTKSHETNTPLNVDNEPFHETDVKKGG